MNFLKGLLAVSALTLGSLAVTSASAGSICSGCNYVGEATYLGSHDPTQGDGSTFTHTAIPDGEFYDLWLFEIDPSGYAAINAIFIPTDAISGFTVNLYQATPTCTLGAPGSLCDSGFFGSFVTSGVTNPNFVNNIGFTFLTAGYYVFEIFGTVSGGLPNNFYSGNLTTQVRVPEPATLALLGMGLLGLGAVRRRRN